MAGLDVKHNDFSRFELIGNGICELSSKTMGACNIYCVSDISSENAVNGSMNERTSNDATFIKDRVAAHFITSAIHVIKTRTSSYDHNFTGPVNRSLGSRRLSSNAIEHETKTRNAPAEPEEDKRNEWKCKNWE